MLSIFANSFDPAVPVLSRTESQTVSSVKSSDKTSSISTDGHVTNSTKHSSSSGSSTASPAPPALMPLKKKTYSDPFPMYVPAEQEKNKEKEKSSALTSKETEPAEPDELGN